MQVNLGLSPMLIAGPPPQRQPNSSLAANSDRELANLKSPTSFTLATSILLNASAVTTILLQLWISARKRCKMKLCSSIQF